MWTQWEWTLKRFSFVILSDLWTILKWFLSNFWWFANHSEMILKQFLVFHEPFWNDSWAISVFCEPFWKNSWVILSNLQTFLKWFSVFCEPFWNHSQCFVNPSEMILEQSEWNHCFTNHSEIILEHFSDFWWFTNHSEMILEWFSVIHEPFWNDSWTISVILSVLWTILK